MNKSILKTNTSRRNFLGGTAATVALTAGVGTPWIAQAASNVKIGLIHPATGWAAYPAAQLRYGAQMAIADINAAGGIKSMGGAQLEALLGDSQTKPEIGAAEVEKMNERGDKTARVHGSSFCVCRRCRRGLSSGAFVLVAGPGRRAGRRGNKAERVHGSAGLTPCQPLCCYCTNGDSLIFSSALASALLKSTTVPFNTSTFSFSKARACSVSKM